MSLLEHLRLISYWLEKTKIVAKIIHMQDLFSVFCLFFFVLFIMMTCIIWVYDEIQHSTVKFNAALFSHLHMYRWKLVAIWNATSYHVKCFINIFFAQHFQQWNARRIWKVIRNNANYESTWHIWRAIILTHFHHQHWCPYNAFY